MKKKICLMWLVISSFVLINIQLVAQTSKAESILQKYGFNLNCEGTISKVDNNELSIVPDEMKTDGRSMVQVSVNLGPSVYLPGTYGGRFYFSENPNSNLLANRILSDKIVVNGLEFIKEYWVVYGGAGGWETVINSYTKQNGNYYTISLQHSFIFGMPGTMEGDKKVSKEDFIKQALSDMKNNSDQYVKSYDNILSSFTLTY